MITSCYSLENPNDPHHSVKVMKADLFNLAIHEMASLIRHLRAILVMHGQSVMKTQIVLSGHHMAFHRLSMSINYKFVAFHTFVQCQEVILMLTSLQCDLFILVYRMLPQKCYSMHLIMYIRK